MSVLTRAILCSLLFVGVAVAQDITEPVADAKPFRTDGGDESLPWYQIEPGKFPPPGSAHYFSGELIQVDHLERSFVLRVDRTDAQNRGHFDLPVVATMLPYGSVFYHGAPAALSHVPIGTHLHGWFYKKSPSDPGKPLPGWHNRKSIEADFTRCFKLEDDFSYCQRRQQSWRIDAIDRDAQTVTGTLLRDEKQVGQPQTFKLQESTRFWIGRRIGTLDDLAIGQRVQWNITWATLYGPGRLVEVWLDDDALELAREHQLAKHRIHIRQRGLAGRVDAVDNAERIVTITLFDGVDESLFEDVTDKTSMGLAVAKENLMTYDPVNDRKRGPILEVKRVPKEPGSSGVQVRVRPDLLLEGYRPGRIVRMYPSQWPVIALPREEQWFGR